MVSMANLKAGSGKKRGSQLKGTVSKSKGSKKKKGKKKKGAKKKARAQQKIKRLLAAFKEWIATQQEKI